MNKRLLRREQFPVTRSLVYLNHAAVGPLTESAYRAMEAHAREQRDLAALHWRDWMEEYDDFRVSAARLIGANPSEISILKNTTEGLSFVAEGFRWERGENVVTTDMEFSSNFAPWKRLERRGVECRTVANRGGIFAPEDVEQRIDSKTRIVALSLVSFHNGFVPDLESIGRICAEKGVLLCVDAIQGAGAIRVDVESCNISFLAADGHKWMLGPEGTAIFYAKASARDSLEPLESGWVSLREGARILNGAGTPHDDGRRFEGGSLSTNLVHGLRASIDLLHEVGLDFIEEEVLEVASDLAARLEDLGFTIHSPRPLHSGIVAVTPPALKEEALRSSRLYTEENLSAASARLAPVHLLQRYLESERIIVTAREKMLRISPHFYNDDSDLDTLIDALREIVA